MRATILAHGQGVVNAATREGAGRESGAFEVNLAGQRAGVESGGILAAATPPREDGPAGYRSGDLMPAETGEYYLGL